jgi:protein ImuB
MKEGTASPQAPAAFAVLRAEAFGVQALRRHDPALAGRPVALLTGAGREFVIAERSPEATGIRPGDPAALALARCPGLCLGERNVEAEVEAQRLLLAAALALSPRVEATAPGMCTVDLQGADAAATDTALRRRLTDLARAGLEVRAGLAASPLVAAYAARRADATNPVLAVTDPATFLAPLPLAWAEPAPACAALLERWGIRTLGELTALPKADLANRLGSEGVALWERSAGQSRRVLRLAEPSRTFAAEWSYEPAVESLPPLLFRLRRYAERVAFELSAAHCVADGLALTLFLEDGTEHRRDFRLPEPCGQPDRWMRVLQAHLDTVRTAARVRAARLVASPARPPQVQDGLFDTGLQDPPAFWDNLARIAALVGDERVGTPEPGDSPRPENFRLRPPAEAISPPAPAPVHPARGPVLRRFRPAWPVCVACAARRPVRIEGAGLQAAVRDARGPWRASGEWWKPRAWAVETWHVELAGGGLYQLARAGLAWRVEGLLD